MADINTPDTTEETAKFLRGWRFSFSNEDELQQGIWKAIGENIYWVGSGWKREHVLSKKDRIDFFQKSTGIGIEVKIGHALSALTRQLHSYSQYESINGLVLVTSKIRLTALPDSINGKPIRIVNLIGSIL